MRGPRTVARFALRTSLNLEGLNSASVFVQIASMSGVSSAVVVEHIAAHFVVAEMHGNE